MEEGEKPAGSVNHVVVSKPAEQDIVDIWLHIAADNLRAADLLAVEFQAKFALLAAAPEIGHARQDLPPGLRCFPVGNYLIIYEHLADEIRIIRVLHGARHIESLV